MVEVKKDSGFKSKPRITLLFSVFLFIISLTQDAYTYRDHEGLTAFSSMEALLMGSTAILAGGLLEWLIWLTNPLYIIGTVLFLSDNKISIKFINVAAVLAISFALWTEVLVSESGQKGTIVYKEFGYWFWLMSIIVMMIGINRYFETAEDKEPPEIFVDVDDDHT
jgi:hypothetical protein